MIFPSMAVIYWWYFLIAVSSAVFINAMLGRNLYISYYTLIVEFGRTNSIWIFETISATISIIEKDEHCGNAKREIVIKKFLIIHITYIFNMNITIFIVQNTTYVFSTIINYFYLQNWKWREHFRCNAKRDTGRSINILSTNSRTQFYVLAVINYKSQLCEIWTFRCNASRDMRRLIFLIFHST